MNEPTNARANEQTPNTPQPNRRRAIQTHDESGQCTSDKQDLPPTSLATPKRRWIHPPETYHLTPAEKTTFHQKRHGPTRKAPPQAKGRKQRMHTPAEKNVAQAGNAPLVVWSLNHTKWRHPLRQPFLVNFKLMCCDVYLVNARGSPHCIKGLSDWILQFSSRRVGGGHTQFPSGSRCISCSNAGAQSYKLTNAHSFMGDAFKSYFRHGSYHRIGVADVLKSLCWPNFVQLCTSKPSYWKSFVLVSWCACSRCSSADWSPEAAHSWQPSDVLQERLSLQRSKVQETTPKVEVSQPHHRLLAPGCLYLPHVFN